MLRGDLQLQELAWPLENAAQQERLQSVWDQVWPPEEKPNPLQYASEPPPDEDWPRSQRARLYLLTHTETGRFLAGARIAPRRVRVGEKSLVVLALASVFSHPEHQGHGYGRLIVQKAFRPVDTGDFEVALFQTPVPGFYESLNCKLISNPISNSLAVNRKIRPFWQDHAMIYPAHFPWPEGELDLVGPGW